jgi:cytochrome c oxidase cbb3-type subunit III
MSDFFSAGWSWYVAVATILGLVACLALLIIASRRRVMADDNTTGHIWDEDLRELNNPLPRWWMWLFVITVGFSVAYLVFYPGLGSFSGQLGWSSQGQLEAEQQTARARLATQFARYAAMDEQALMKDEQAMATGQRLFLNQCAACHGSDARGSRGFPSLADADWLGERSLDAVQRTIVEGRTGVMPPMGAALGGAENVRNVAQYVLSLSGSPHNPIAAQLGRSQFATCAACHGAQGQGNPALGAPNLRDDVWLHGWGEAAIVKIINEGLNNPMPPQARLLTPEQVRVLAAYVLSLSPLPASAPAN